MAQWNPYQGEWGKADDGYIRVMTWNVDDGICSTNSKQEGLNDWTALAVIVASMQPDVLIMQEAGDNDGCGTGTYSDSVSQLTTVMDLFFNGGYDPFHGNSQVTAYVAKYAPGYTLPYIFVSGSTDGYNRNVIASRFPFADLNGDGKSQLSDMPWISADEYAPGGTGGARGFQIAEIDLPNADYDGDLVVGNSHLKAGQTSGDKAQRLTAGKNIAYLIDYWYNGAGTGSPDPHNKISDSPAATRILDGYTPVIWGGDWNEDEVSNGRDGPALWMVRAQYPESSQSDGTDRDRSDSRFDTAVHPISGYRGTYGSNKLDYLAGQDSIAAERLEFNFDSANLNATQMPPEIQNNFGVPLSASGYASPHKPVICDYEMSGGVLPEPPVPDALVNDDDGPLFLPGNYTAEFKIALDPKDWDGAPADWWVFLEKDSNSTWWCQYNGGSKKWTKSAAPIRFAGVGLRTVNGYKVLGPMTLPVGGYIFTFAVDEKNDSYEGTYADTVELTVF
jgi:hypothetical protein